MLRRQPVIEDLPRSRMVTAVRPTSSTEAVSEAAAATARTAPSVPSMLAPSSTGDQACDSTRDGPARPCRPPIACTVSESRQAWKPPRPAATASGTEEAQPRKPSRPSRPTPRGCHRASRSLVQRSAPPSQGRAPPTRVDTCRTRAYDRARWHRRSRPPEAAASNATIGQSEIRLESRSKAFPISCIVTLKGYKLPVAVSSPIRGVQMRRSLLRAAPGHVKGW